MRQIPPLPPRHGLVIAALVTACTMVVLAIAGDGCGFSAGIFVGHFWGAVLMRWAVDERLTPPPAVE